ncbi:hypothetical protein ACWIF8_01600 [Micromonospora chalcea]
MKRDMTLDDFFTGLLAALADRGVGVLAVRGDEFYQAVRTSYQTLEHLASRYQIDPRFAIFLDPIYGDSALVREAVGSAIVRHLATLESSESQDLRIRLGREQAESLLRQLPGSAELYEKLADAFLGSYPFVAA